MPVPKEWPTLEETSTLSVDVIIKAFNAAEWAVTVRPQLEALVAKWKQGRTGNLTKYGEVAQAQLTICADDLEAILTSQEEHEETQG